MGIEAKHGRKLAPLCRLSLQTKNILEFCFYVCPFMTIYKLCFSLAALGPGCGTWTPLSLLQCRASYCGVAACLAVACSQQLGCTQLVDLWHLDSLTRDQTWVPCIGSRFLTTGPPGKSPFCNLLKITNNHDNNGGLPWWLRLWRIRLQCRKLRFSDLWVGNVPWRREWLPTPVFLPGEYHGQRLVGY